MRPRKNHTTVARAGTTRSQRRGRLRLGGKDLHIRSQRAHRGADSSEQAAAADRRHDRVDIGKILEDLEACRSEGIGLQIWYSAPADKYFVLLADGIASVHIVDVDGERQVFLTQYRSATSDEDLRELQLVLDSIRIEA